VAFCDHDSLFGLPVGSGLVFRLLATVRVFSAGSRRARGFSSSCEAYSKSAARVTFDSHSRVLSVATLIRLPFRRRRFRVRHFAAPGSEFMVRVVTLSSLPQTVGIPHSQASRSLSVGALLLPFPATSVVPAVNYYRLLSLTRLLQASGPFSLRPKIAGETAAPLSGVCGHPVLFFHHTASCGRSLDFFRLHSSRLESCRKKHSHSTPSSRRHPRLGRFYRSRLTAPSGLAQPHSSFVTVR
jgi:hypothetical protein